jgi:hypothetical protein
MPLYPHGKNPQHPPKRNLSGLQGQSGYLEEDKNLLPVVGIEIWIIQPIDYSMHCQL